MPQLFLKRREFVHDSFVMKRERDEDDGSAPIVEKEKRSLFGIDSPSGLYTNSPPSYPSPFNAEFARPAITDLGVDNSDDNISFSSSVSDDGFPDNSKDSNNCGVVIDVEGVSNIINNNNNSKKHKNNSNKNKHNSNNSNSNNNFDYISHHSDSLPKTETKGDSADSASSNVVGSSPRRPPYITEQDYRAQCEFFQKLSDRVNGAGGDSSENEEDVDTVPHKAKRVQFLSAGFNHSHRINHSCRTTDALLRDKRTDVTTSYNGGRLNTDPAQSASLRPILTTTNNDRYTGTPGIAVVGEALTIRRRFATPGDEVQSQGRVGLRSDPKTSTPGSVDDSRGRQTCIIKSENAPTAVAALGRKDLDTSSNAHTDLQVFTDHGTSSTGKSVVAEGVTESTSTRKIFTAKRASFQQNHTASTDNVAVRTHIKLHRPKSTDNMLGGSKKGSKPNPVDLAETMKAFLRTHDTDELLNGGNGNAMFASSPDISTKKSRNYWKRLHTFVTGRSAKSLTELMVGSSADDVSSKQDLGRRRGSVKPKSSDGKESDPASSCSSSESLSDQLTASNARQILDNMEHEERLEKTAKDDKNMDDGNGDNGESGDETDDSSGGSSKNAGYTTAVSLQVPAHGAGANLNVNKPFPNTDSQHKLLPPALDASGLGVKDFRSCDNLPRVRKKRQRNHVSETNYSLLRPDPEDGHNSSSSAATVTFTRIPSIRRSRYSVTLRHHLTVNYDPEDPADLHTLKDAIHVTALETGEAIVTDILSNKLIVFDAYGKPEVTFAVETGSEPYATSLTPGGDLAVTLKRQGCVSLWSPSGEPISEFGQEDLSSPAGIQCDSKGRFIVADEETDSVLVFNSRGKFVSELLSRRSMTNTDSTMHGTQSSSTSFSKPRYVCLTANGNCVISDSANHCVKIFDSSLNFVRQFGTYGRCDGQFKFPYGVATDESGHLFIADHFNNRVSLFSKDGDFLEHLLSSSDQITRPKGIAVKNGLMYVTYGDLRANKIAVFRIKTV